MAKKRPQLVIVTQYYDPEPAYKGQIFAEAIHGLGYDVKVVTGFPNYPGGKIYKDFKIRIISKEKVNNISIVRLPLYPSHGPNRIGRAFNYISFSFSAFIYLSLFCKKVDILYAYNPPLTVGLAAALSKFFLRKTKVVVDIHDLWPDSLPATGMLSNQRIIKMLDLSANWMYRTVDFIVTHTHGFTVKLQERGANPDRMKAIIGWAHEVHPPPTDSIVIKTLDDMHGLRLLYAGNLGPAQGLESVIEAAYFLKNSGKEKCVSFCFLGDGLCKRNLEELAVRYELNNVHFLGRVDTANVGDYLSAADALLVHLKDEELFEITIPSKTQTYLLAAKPILMAVKGEAAQLVLDSNSGVVASSGDPFSIARAALELASLSKDERASLGANGASFYKQNLSMEKGMEKFEEVFSKLLKENRDI